MHVPETSHHSGDIPQRMIREPPLFKGAGGFALKINQIPAIRKESLTQVKITVDALNGYVIIRHP